MPATGFIQLRAYTSTAQFPLKDVAITVTASDGTAIAMRLTDRNGLITPIELPVPDRAESLQPDPAERPFATVNLYAGFRRYHHLSESGDDSTGRTAPELGSDGHLQHTSTELIRRR